MATVNDKIKNALNAYNIGLQNKLSGVYVQKIQGKDLSTNDFTDALKTKLDGLSSVNTSNFVQKDGSKVLSTNDFTDAYKNKLDAVDTSTYVQKIQGKDLSTNDFTDSYKNTIDGLSGVYVQKTQGKDLSTNDFTDAYKFTLDGLSGVYAKKADITNIFTYIGSVSNAAALPTTDTTVGSVYNLLAGGGSDENGISLKEGDNVAWTGTGWDVLGGSVDLSGYVQKDGAKVLSTNDFTDSYKNTIDGLSGVYVQKDGSKVLSTNDFTDADKLKLDSLSTSTSVGMSFYLGTSAPTDPNVIWFDTSIDS